MPHFKVYPDSEHFMSDSCPAAGSLGVQVPRPVGELSATFRRLQQVFETHRSSQILSSLWDHCPSLKGATVEASENDEKQRPGAAGARGRFLASAGGVLAAVGVSPHGWNIHHISGSCQRERQDTNQILPRILYP